MSETRASRRSYVDMTEGLCCRYVQVKTMAAVHPCQVVEWGVE